MATVGPPAMWIAALSVVGVVGIVGWERVRQLTNEAEARWVAELASYADAATVSIEAWVQSRHADAAALADFATLVAGPGDVPPEHVPAALRHLATVRERYGYRGVSFVHDGAVVLPVGAVVPDSSDVALAAQAIRSQQVEMMGPRFDRDSALRVTFAAPTTRVGPLPPTGAVLLIADPVPYLFATALGERQPSRSGGYALVRREANEFVVITPPRLTEAGPLEVRIPWSELPTPGRMALERDTFEGRGTDFRGREVLTVSRRVTGTNWALLRKMDVAEALAGARAQLATEGAGVVGLIAIVMLVSVSRRRAARSEGERRHAETEVLSLRPYHALFDQTGDGVIVTGLDGTVKEINPAAQRLCQADRTAMIGRPLSDVLTPGAPGLPGWWDETIRADDGPVVAEWELDRGAGALTVETSASAIRSADGVRDSVQIIIRDITRRRREEIDLRRRERHFSKLVSRGWDLVQLVDELANVTYVSDSLTRVAGYARDGYVGGSAFRYFHPSDRELCIPVFEQMVGRGLAHHTDEVRFRHADGHWLWMEAALVNYLDDPDIAAVVINCRDVTERKRAELQLRESEQNYRRLANRHQRIREDERTAVAREMHDELGQTLTAARLEAAWIASRLRARPAATQEAADRSACLVELVDDAIDSVRTLSSSLRPPILDDLGLDAAAEWHVNEFAIRTGIDTALSIADAFECPDGVVATAFYRILQESLTNVVRHADARGVRVELSRDNGTIRLEVRDNGRGIDPARVNRPGAMGITGMHERAAELGGRVTVTPCAGARGTCVVASIPLTG